MCDYTPEAVYDIGNTDDAQTEIIVAALRGDPLRLSEMCENLGPTSSPTPWPGTSAGKGAKPRHCLSLGRSAKASTA